MSVQTGEIKKNAGKHGFILMDSGEDLFVLPMQCVGFERQIPPLGTRVQFTLGQDPQKGAPLAENVEPEQTLAGSRPARGSRKSNVSSLQQPAVNGLCAGAVKDTKDKHGFILQDSGERDMFFMPVSCEAFGGVCPPVGTRVLYEIVIDGKTGRPRAENVQPEDGAYQSFQPLLWQSGQIKKNVGRSGFILTDSGEDLFLLPKQCVGFGGQIPPLGTRVQYTIGVDPQKGNPLAENVEPEPSLSPARPSKRALPAIAGPEPPVKRTRHGKGTQATNNLHPPAAHGLFAAGAIKDTKEKHGFISQDSGERDMFFMPVSCEAFGGVCPPVGTRVLYEIVIDGKTGRPRAENIQPEDGGYDQYSPPQFSQSGQIKKNAGNSGFILTDGGEDLFVLPKQCVGFGKQIPPVGTRVQFTVGTDPKKGAPLAENVEPERIMTGSRPARGSRKSNMSSLQQPDMSSLQQPAARGLQAGSIKDTKEKHGFILQDNGERDMFFMPVSCVGFGGVFPPVGTRVVYEIVTDGKTGRPRAENIQPEDGGYDQSTPPLFWQSGQIKKNAGRSGFILTDSGEDLFLLPKQCFGFGGQIPPVGTRVQFTIGVDPQKGAPLAENVEPDRHGPPEDHGPPRGSRQPAKGSRPAGASRDGSRKQYSVPEDHGNVQQPTDHELHAGAVKDTKEKHGFILQDSGERDMFFMPVSCGAFGGVCPPVGTRVVYEIVIDGKSGRPRAENIQPESGNVP